MASGKTLRRLWHLLGGAFFPILALSISQRTLLVATGATAGAFLVGDVVRLAVPAVNRRAYRLLPGVLRERENADLTGTSYLLLGTLLAFLLLPRAEASAGLLFLAVGDPVASAVGERTRIVPLLGKSLGGTLAFSLSAGAVAAVLALVGPGPALWVGLVGAAVAAVVELLPLPLNDNLLVPLVSGSAMVLLAR